MRILILTGKFGQGHYSAAKTLAEEINSSGLAADVQIIDIYEQLFPLGCNLMYGAYAKLIKRGCKLYNLAYQKTTSKTDSRTTPLQKHFTSVIANLVRQQQPDVIISTYSFCAQLAAQYKQATGSAIPLITCITDISAHNVWINEGTNLYLAASEDTRQSLLASGVSAQRIIVSGIPVKATFKAQASDMKPQRKKHLLIMGGGLGLLPESKAFYQGLSQIQDLTVTIITGSNRRLYKRLHGKYANITVLGFTDKVPYYMRQADLIISKPGGITLFEAIYSELPMVIFSPFLEQEIHNGQFIAENGIGFILNQRPELSLGQLQLILSDDQALTAARRNMRQLKSRLQSSGLINYLSYYQNWPLESQVSA